MKVAVLGDQFEVVLRSELADALALGVGEKPCPCSSVDSRT
jgi:hypothetical protein